MGGIVRTGCSSWTSESWWGTVYARGLPPGERLSAYARRYDTVEVDASYYRDPGAALVRRWRRATPDRFVFAMKFPRELLDPKVPLNAEKIAAFESHARELGPKLGPLLLQFPPWVKPGRAGRFLRELLEALDPELRHAVELRDAGWFQGAEHEALLRELGDRRIALAWSYLTYVDVPAELTTDFVYLRFIGDHTTVPAEVHGSLRVDRSAETKRWAAHVAAALDRIENAFAYFNNHFAGFAPASVNLFRAELGLEPIDYSPELPEAASGARQLRLP
jgi:uncharacterized protein YecE (DUF72 family)